MSEPIVANMKLSRHIGDTLITVWITDDGAVQQTRARIGEAIPTLKQLRKARKRALAELLLVVHQWAEEQGPGVPVREAYRAYVKADDAYNDARPVKQKV